MRKGQGHPDCPALDGEGFLDYLERLARFQGYEVRTVAGLPKQPRARGNGGFLERLDSIFAKTREPGEDVA